MALRYSDITVLNSWNIGITVLNPYRCNDV